MKRALLLIDIQNDFLPGGQLAVPQGDEIIPIVNQLLEEPFDLVVATKDWHPLGYSSFATTHKKNPGDTVSIAGCTQILWPDHCIQKAKGSEFGPGLNVSKIDKIFYKGTDVELDSYSAFFDNFHLNSTGLGDYLKDRGIGELHFAGLATDYCVKFSVLDALDLGFTCYVVQDGCRAVNIQQDDEANAYREMEERGAKIICTSHSK